MCLPLPGKCKVLSKNKLFKLFSQGKHTKVVFFISVRKYLSNDTIISTFVCHLNHLFLQPGVQNKVWWSGVHMFKAGTIDPEKFHKQMLDMEL